MKVYMYRLIGENCNEVGLAVVDNLERLFWLLDEFTNPYDYQFCSAKVGDAISIAVEFDGDSGDVFEDGDKYDSASESETPTVGSHMSERVADQQRKWSQFIYPHNNEYKTKRV